MSSQNIEKRSEKLRNVRYWAQTCSKCVLHIVTTFRKDRMEKKNFPKILRSIIDICTIPSQNGLKKVKIQLETRQKLFGSSYFCQKRVFECSKHLRNEIAHIIFRTHFFWKKVKFPLSQYWTTGARPVSVSRTAQMCQVASILHQNTFYDVFRWFVKFK